MKKYNKILLIIIIIINIPFIIILNKNIKDFNSMNEHLVQNEFFHTVDLLDDNFDEYKSRLTILEDLSNVNNNLKHAKNFNYIEMKLGTSFVLSNTYRGNESYSYGYQDYLYSEELRSVKSVNLSYEAKDFFDIPVSTGRYFTTDDFTYKNSINILLGSKYNQIYDIGDDLDLIVNGKERQAKVIGFLEEGANLIHFNQKIILDDFIIIPMEKINIQNNDFMYNFKALLDKNNGVVYPLNNKKSMEKELQIICEQNNLPYVLSANINDLYLEKIINVLITVLVFLISIISVVYIRKHR